MIKREKFLNVFHEFLNSRYIFKYIREDMVNCNDTISHFCNYSLIHFNWDNLLTCQQISIDVIAKIMCMQRVCVDVHALCVNCTFIWSLKKKKITWLNIINIARSCLSKSIAGEFHTIESVIRRMQGTPILLAARHFLVRKFPTFTFRFPLSFPPLPFSLPKYPSPIIHLLDEFLYTS